MNSISTINPAITENTECLIIKAHLSLINLKVGVLLDHDALLCFISLLALGTCWATFQAQNNVKSVPASSALTLVSHRSHNACTANHYLRDSGERSSKNKGKLW